MDKNIYEIDIEKMRKNFYDTEKVEGVVKLAPQIFLDTNKNFPFLIIHIDIAMDILPQNVFEQAELYEDYYLIRIADSSSLYTPKEYDNYIYKEVECNSNCLFKRGNQCEADTITIENCRCTSFVDADNCESYKKLLGEVMHSFDLITKLKKPKNK